jgi:DNA ligase-1
MKGTKRLECKLDGVRVLAMCYANLGTVNLFSRNGKAFENFGHIEQQLIPLIKRISIKMFGKVTDFVLDGEITGKTFQDLMKQAQRKRDVNADDSQYNVFDVLPKDDFYRGYWNAQQYKRIDKLEQIRDTIKEHTTSIHIMPGMDVDLDTSEGHSKLEQFADAAVRQGYEGIMIKDVGAPYECRRSSFWMKWKPTITVDLNITGFEEGTGRNAGRLGAIICEGVDNGRRITVNVGSGLSDGDRDEFWAGRDLLLGRCIEVQADAVTQNQDGSYSLRFPRFVRFRGFEPGEKM